MATRTVDAAHDRKGEAEELDEGSGEVELPAEHAGAHPL